MGMLSPPKHPHALFDREFLDTWRNAQASRTLFAGYGEPSFHVDNKPVIDDLPETPHDFAVQSVHAGPAAERIALAIFHNEPVSKRLDDDTFCIPDGTVAPAEAVYAAGRFLGLPGF